MDFNIELVLRVSEMQAEQQRLSHGSLGVRTLVVALSPSSHGSGDLAKQLHASASLLPPLCEGLCRRILMWMD